MGDFIEPRRSVVDRYYTRMYKVDAAKKRGEDVMVLAHSNGICIITLAPSHRIYTEQKTISKIDFNVGRKDRAKSKPNGKSKKGAQEMTELAPLCKIECSDGECFTLVAGVAGALLEVNERLLSQPQLLHDKPDTDGYVAIILPRKQRIKDQLSRLLSAEHYNKKLAQRAERAAHAASDVTRVVSDVTPPDATPASDVTSPGPDTSVAVGATPTGRSDQPIAACSLDHMSEGNVAAREESEEKRIVMPNTGLEAKQTDEESDEPKEKRPRSS